MKLYHCFPRAASSRTRDLQVVLSNGLQVLRTIIEFGIVLTPEDLVVPPNPRSRRETEPRTRFPQERACFTLMRRDELYAPTPRHGVTSLGPSHAAQFGLFAIGLDPIRARVLGTVPVMYFYNAEGMENISSELLFRLRELRTLVVCLSHIEAKAALPDRDVLDQRTLTQLGFNLNDEPVVASRIEHAHHGEALAVVSLLDSDRVPAWNLVDWIDIFLNLFQTADSKTTPDSLAYYQQREWRITKLFGEHVQCYPLDLEPYALGNPTYPESECRKLRKRLQSFDRDFFSDERLDKSSILLGTRDKPFFDFVDEVVLPRQAARAAIDLFEGYGLAMHLDEEWSAADSVSFVRYE